MKKGAFIFVGRGWNVYFGSLTPSNTRKGDLSFNAHMVTHMRLEHAAEMLFRKTVPTEKSVHIMEFEDRPFHRRKIVVLLDRDMHRMLPKHFVSEQTPQ